MSGGSTARAGARLGATHYLQNAGELLVSDTSPAPVPGPTWRRPLKPALTIAALAVVFGWLLPKVIDYQARGWISLTALLRSASSTFRDSTWLSAP
jgi:hypothetical protein